LVGVFEVDVFSVFGADVFVSDEEVEDSVAELDDSDDELEDDGEAALAEEVDPRESLR